MPPADEEAITKFRHALSEAWPDPPPSVYHYTNARGICGIVGKRALRLSSAKFMNDPMELAYGVSRMNNILQDLIPSMSDLDVSRMLKGLAPGSPAAWAAQADVLVGCFSEVDDDLPQWRAYADEGRGYCLEFAVGDVVPFTQEFLWRVIYDVNEQRALLERGVRSLAETVERLEDRTPPRLNGVFAAFVDFFRGVAVTFKQEAYASEKEWRLVVTPRRALHFRPGPRGEVVPYGLCNLGDKPPIKSVRIGPAQRGQHVKESVRMLLRQHGVEKPNVTVSRCEYRGQ